MKPQIGLMIFESNINSTRPAYEVYVSNGDRSDKLFLTSPGIRKMIDTNSLKTGTQVGEIRFMISGGTLIYDWHYPIGKDRSKTKQIFEKSETARYIEQKAISHLEQHHQIQTVKHRDPQNPRILQLERMGFTRAQIQKGIPFKKFKTTLSKSLTSSLIKRRRRL